MAIETISSQQLVTKESIELIDVRMPIEYQTRHAAPAANVPFHTLDQFAKSRGNSDQPLYVICERGVRAAKACEKLKALGCANVINVEGGTHAWEATGLPVIRSVKAFSIERQVRVAAGLLVLIGVIGGLWLHPGFFGLSAFVGAGLTFAGLTDFCGMGLLLAAMPWNKKLSATACGVPPIPPRGAADAAA